MIHLRVTGYFIEVIQKNVRIGRKVELGSDYPKILQTILPSPQFFPDAFITEHIICSRNNGQFYV